MNNLRVRLIGLTGGIGTGKTTVSNYLANAYHLPVLDADIYAREVVEPGSSVLQRLQERFGNRILLPEGTLNRRELGNIIFNNVAERQWLEQQIHPYVRDRFLADTQRLLRDRQESQHSLTVVLAIPLLFEAEMTNLCTEIWVVYCPPDLQLERLRQRENLTLEQAQTRINSQLPLEEKCRRANVVLDNSSTLDALFAQVDRQMQ